MMAVPTADEIRAFLEGYNIEIAVLSDNWIENRRDNFVIPWIQNKTRLNFSAETEYTEYISGNGKEIIVLAKKPVNELISISYISSADVSSNIVDSVELNSRDGVIIKKTSFIEGMTTSVFLKGNQNIKVIYKAGYNDFVDPVTSEVVNDVKEAIICLTAKKILIHVGARTGGGSISGQAWSRNFGNRGKYTDIINDLDATAYEILKKYWTGVVNT